MYLPSIPYVHIDIFRAKHVQEPSFQQKYVRYHDKIMNYIN